MRDPERLLDIIDKIYVIWDANPDWRFGQLLRNVGYLEQEPYRYRSVVLDPFYVEDDRLIELLDKYIKESEAPDAHLPQ